jgi:NitT/TauT family transport system permease protein
MKRLMTMKEKKKSVRRNAVKYTLLSWLIALVVWQGLASLYQNPDLFPSPWQTIQGALLLLEDGSLLKFIGISSARIVAGWALGSCLGVPIGLLMGAVPFLRELLEPFINFFRFIPALAFITLFLMWFGVEEQSKIALITYTTLFIVTLNTMLGVLRVDEEKVRAARSLGANPLQVFFHVIVPATVPSIFNGLRLAMGNSFAAIVGAEMLAANSGVGYLIWTSRLYFRTDWIFVGLFTLGLMGFVADKLVASLSARFFGKYGIVKNAQFLRQV